MFRHLWAITLFASFFFVLFTSITTASSVPWHTTVIPPIDHTTYQSLHACITNKHPDQATKCFENVIKTRSPLTSLTNLDNPPLLIVPDCLESVLLANDTTNPLFIATILSSHNFENVTLFRSPKPYSVRNIEFAHPPRRIPGGGYTVLANALQNIGYIDGDSMRAIAWDWHLPVQHITQQIIALIDNSNMIMIARGAGCALAASSAKTRPIRAILCLSEPTDGILPAGLFANELGLVTRRRGRPVPIVAGPWGDGKGPRRCDIHRSIESVDIVDSVKVLCADDCKRWVKGARIEDCDYEGEMTNELECLINVLLTLS